MWTWIKKKWKLITGFLFPVIIGSTLILGAPSNIPVQLRLEASKQDIVHTQDYIDEKGVVITNYSYKSGELAPTLDNEIIEQRTPHIVYRNLGGNKRSAQSGFNFYREGNRWKKLKYATTTKEAYQKQTTSFLNPLIAWATDTSATSPGTMADDSAVGTVAWTNVDNVKVNDASVATCQNGADPFPVYCHYLKATNFGFSVAGIIDGIFVQIERQSFGSVVSDEIVKIVLADASIGSENKAKAPVWGVTTSYTDYGSSSDLWSETWSDTDINDSDFGVVIAPEINGNFTNGQVDHIQITITYTAGALITTDTATSILDTSATMNGNLTDTAGDTLDIGFTYGIDSVLSATTTTETATSSIGTYSDNVTGLTTFEEYGFQAFASSTPGSATSTISRGDTYQFFTADISTSTPVVTADNHAWDLSDFSHGSTTKTGGTTILSLILQGAGISTTTDSFESVSDGSQDFSSTNLWKQATISTDNGNWQGETGATGSSNTGADDGSDGTVFIYTEGSSGQQCDSGSTCIIEADITDDVDGAIAFDYSMDGNALGTLALDAYNDSTWTELWAVTGDQGTGGGYASAYVTWDSGDGYTVLRFDHNGMTNFESDASLDFIRVATSSSAYEDGAWTSPPWTITGVDSVDDSYIEFASTTPSDTAVRVMIAVNSDSGTQPDEGDFTEVTSGGNMSGGGVTGDLTGDFVWVRIELDASTDQVDTPTVTQLIMGINDGEAGPAVRRIFLVE